MEAHCLNPKILRVVDDLVIPASIEIRSEEMTLIGNSSRLLFQRDIEPNGKLEWATKYEVTRVMWLPKGELVEEGIKLSETPSGKITFTTPKEPPRISSADCSLGGDQQKSAVVALTGVKLGGGMDFNVTVRKMEGLMPIGDELVLTGILSGGSSSTTHTHTELIFGALHPPLSFGTTYLITQFTVDGSVSALDADATFSVSPEPPCIVGIESRELNKDRTKLKLFLDGRALLSRAGMLSLANEITNCESSSDVIIHDNTHCTVEFAVGEEETSTQLKFGVEYTLKGSWTESSGFHVEDGITVIPLPPKITKMKFSFSNTLNTGCFVKLTGTDLIVGESLNVTLNDSLSFIATITSTTEAQSGELQIGWPSTLQHNTEYTITSIKTMHEDDGETLCDSSVSDTTGSLPADIAILVDSDSSSDSSSGI
ncbi:hypothetical protein BLNAU_9333 [Blattamonas nauphoetae]|uniref:Ig-like domain-containing protein n=1 Tax=Blattamonas nauphoetae TaxID=2049346 RepID=A0ABQ9XVY5_9EUKA|nr:hypothetical protein BLNAU_9333 [Blattamonas nauphoetae]